MSGAGVQRKPPGDVLLNSTDWSTGTVAMVPEMGKVTPPSVERDHITLFGTVVIVPQRPGPNLVLLREGDAAGTDPRRLVRATKRPGAAGGWVPDDVTVSVAVPVRVGLPGAVPVSVIG